jgi:uncharacterized protein
MAQSFRQKKEKLMALIGEYPSLGVAFSGGVDSSLLLAVAHKMLGTCVTAFTAQSPTHPANERLAAEKIAKGLGVRHIVFKTNEMNIHDFTENTPQRCYYCKKELFQRMREEASGLSLHVLAHGANLDDQDDFRPGFRAAQEQNIRSPLVEAGLTKADVRQLAQEEGLPNWNRPAMACLATRIPYGTRISPVLLSRIEQAEALIRRLGITACRVRDHDTLARIEVDSHEIESLCSEQIRLQLVDGLIRLGYHHVCIDLEGYQAGKMNRGVETNGEMGA